MEVQLLPKFDMDNITTKVKPIFVIKKSLTTNFYLLYINLSKSIVNPLIMKKNTMWTSIFRGFKSRLCTNNL